MRLIVVGYQETCALSHSFPSRLVACFGWQTVGVLETSPVTAA